MKPVLTYYGGKQRLAKRIVDILMNIEHKVYVEPFAGGASVLFMKPKVITSNRDHYRECINDIDSDIINVYRACQEHKDELIHLLTYTPFSQEEYRKALEIMKDKENHSSVRRAWAVIVLIRQSFANIYKGSWATGKKSENKAVTWKTYKELFPIIIERLNDVYISNEDALHCIKRWDSEYTLFYIDPPYIGSDLGHYDWYTEDDYDKLLAVLNQLKGKYVLSNYQQEKEPCNYEEKIEYRKVVSSTVNTRTEKKEVLYIKRSVS